MMSSINKGVYKPVTGVLQKFTAVDDIVFYIGQIQSVWNTSTLKYR